MLSKIGKTFSAAQIRKYPGHGTPACVSYPGRASACPTTPPGFDTYLCVPWPGYLGLSALFTLCVIKIVDRKIVASSGQHANAGDMSAQT